MTDKNTILIVEDEQDIRDLIELHLRRENYGVETAANAETALQKIKNQTFEVIILDWMLPGLSGLEIAKVLRSQKNFTPILMVTAKNESTDIIQGLESGADDYITKPFEIPVLLARVKALLRRQELKLAPHDAQSQSPASTPPIQLGDLIINPLSHEVTYKKEPLSLTLSEFKLLLALAQNQGRVLTRDQLIDLVQGDGVNVIDRAIDTHIFGLRKKLGDAAHVVETVRGVGYRIKA